MTSEVGIFAVGVRVPTGNERLFLRLIFRPCPLGTVIKIGDQTPAPAPRFKVEQLAELPASTAPQL